MKAPGDGVHLLADRLKFFARTCEVERIKRALIDLEIVDSAKHGPPFANVFVREKRPAQASFDRYSRTLAANHLSRQVFQRPSFILTKQFRHAGWVIYIVNSRLRDHFH